MPTFLRCAVKCSPFRGTNFHGRNGLRTLPFSSHLLCLQRICQSVVTCSGVEEQPDKSRGGLPRFHVHNLPVLEGMIARVEGDEFSHMTKVLRLKVNDRFSEGWAREWLVEKCTELGARTLTPLLTHRSSSVSGGRTDRWQRIAIAATKQCQRLHNLEIREPILLQSFLPQVSQVEIAFMAAADAPPLIECLTKIPSMPQRGLLFIGPEGDFTPEEIISLVDMGTRVVGLGPRRLRVETATVAMLAAVMLMADKQQFAL